ncbi:MAG: hypothetical protein QG608_1297 [Actinomycetota bacterium]|nr:hypothetical protein [Actinomycetota bacterium]
MGHDHRADTGGGQPDRPPGDQDSGADELVSWIRKSPNGEDRPGNGHRLRIERILYPLLALSMALGAVGIIVSNRESIVLDWRGHSAEARVDWAFQAGSGSRVGVSYTVGRDRHAASLRVGGERIPEPGESIAVEYDPSDPGRVRTRAPRTALYGLLLILSLATVSGVSTVRTALLRRENDRP